jgi:HD-like signal output (HDOD) protein
MLALIGCGADGGAAAEQQVFGATHAQVGGYLLGLWGLPLPVVEAVSFHHQPALAAEKLFSPLTAVHVANALVQVADGAAEENADLPLDGGYLAALGLTDRVPVWRNELRKETESLKTS